MFGFFGAWDVAFMEGILYFGGIANEHITRDRAILSNGVDKTIGI